MTTFETQKIMRDTFAGPKPITAPAGWEFDKTATIVWVKLLELTRNGFEPFKTKRDKAVWEGRINTLANVLACSLGMASPYWENQAFEIVLEERKR